jgi:hypothetical protein
MKPPKSKRNHTRPRRKPPPGVRYVLSALDLFGAKPASVPKKGDPPPVWQAWRWARAERVAIPLHVLDRTAAVLLALLEPGPSGATQDAGIDRALRLAQYLKSKTLAARAVAVSEAWHRPNLQAWKQIWALERRERKDGVNLGEAKAGILEELHKAVDGDVDRKIEERAQHIRRAMNPSRRRAKS